MFKLIAAILILLCIQHASAAIQANESALYYDTETYYSINPTTGATGQSVLYVYIADVNDLANAKKAVFFPHVDQFMRLEIMDSFINFTNLVARNDTNSTGTTTDTFVARSNNNSTYVWLQFGNRDLNMTTVPKRYTYNEFITASFSAVIQLTRGVPTGISWDDGCNECNSSVDSGAFCLDNSCAIRILECFICDDCSNQTCNIKIYLGWIGTDGVGRPLTSAGSLPSNFAKFSLTPVFRNAAGTLKDQLTSASNTNENYDPRFDPNSNTPKYTIS
jgi:hypothetical protein